MKNLLQFLRKKIDMRKLKKINIRAKNEHEKQEIIKMSSRKQKN